MSDLSGDRLSDAAYLADQYKDSSKLAVRRRLYELYGDRAEPAFFCWVFDAIELPASPRVLEVGCGVGSLWLENAGRVPPDAVITLGDSSPAMVDSARKNLQSSQFSFECFDVQEIPHGDATFDAVVACHMLYHVRDRPKALREIRRVLRPGGTFYATTNAWTHLIELRALIERFVSQPYGLPARYLPDAFDAENGARELQGVFRSLTVRQRRGLLKVTDAAHLVDYVRSTVPDGVDFREQALREHLEWLIGIQDHVPVTVAAALLVAER